MGCLTPEGCQTPYPHRADATAMGCLTPEGCQTPYPHRADATAMGCLTPEGCQTPYPHRADATAMGCLTPKGCQTPSWHRADRHSDGVSDSRRVSDTIPAQSRRHSDGVSDSRRVSDTVLAQSRPPQQPGVRHHTNSRGPRLFLTSAAPSPWRVPPPDANGPGAPGAGRRTIGVRSGAPLPIAPRIRPARTRTPWPGRPARLRLARWIRPRAGALPVRPAGWSASA